MTSAASHAFLMAVALPFSVYAIACSAMVFVRLPHGNIDTSVMSISFFKIVAIVGPFLALSPPISGFNIHFVR